MQKTKNVPNHPNIQIAVENFGPIEKADVDLRPLTVFVGESNTGKTYLAALIYALHQTFVGSSRFPWSDSSAFSLRYIFSSRYRSSSTQTELDEKEILGTLEKLDSLGQPIRLSDLPDEVCEQLQAKLKDPGICRDELKRCFDLESISELVRITDSKSNKKRSLLKRSRSTSYKVRGTKILLKVHEGDQTLWSFSMEGSGSNFTADGSINKNMLLQSNNKTMFEGMGVVEDLSDFFYLLKRESGNSYYLPAARSGIMQSHGVIASSLVDRATRVGLEHFSEIATFSGMIVDFLKQIISYEERHISSDEMIDIAKALENEVLRGEIEVKRPVAMGYPEFLYRPQKVKKFLRMSQSSSMVSELAPLVLFLRGIVRPGDTLIIEEPESHLHPRAQTQIVFTLARLVRAGVRVIITTHSNWLLEQISNLVREGEVMRADKSCSERVPWLTKDEVGAWLFRMDKPVEDIPFEHIAGIEPEEYGEVAEELHNRSVDLRTQLEETVGGTGVEQE